MVFLQMKAADPAVIADDKFKFVYTVPYEGFVDETYVPDNWRRRIWNAEGALVHIKGTMKEVGAQDEVQYFIKIAANKKISDTEKIEKKRVYTDFFKRLEKKDQQEKDNFLTELVKMTPDANYPVERLLFAAWLYSGVKIGDDIGRKLLEKVSLKSDISLAKKLLSCGVSNWADTTILVDCKSVKMAQLLINYGGDVTKAFEINGHSLISSLCIDGQDPRRRDWEKLLPLYLSHTPLDGSTKFRMQYLEEVVYDQEWDIIDADVKLTQIKIFLTQKCQYSNAIKEKVLEKIGNQSQEAERKVKEIFMQYAGQKISANIKKALL